MSSSAAAPPSPLSAPEPWDLVCDGYVAELWEQFSRFAASALELAALPPNADVLDVAAGPGTLTVQAARRAQRVTAVDFSPRMLAELRARVAAEGLTNVEALEADGQALPFADGSFDGALSMFGLIFFPERSRGFRELRRVLRPGGRAVVSSWLPFDQVPPLRATFDTLVELMPELPFGKGKAPLGDRDEFAAELHQAGFDAVDVREVTHHFVAESTLAFWRSMERSSAPFVLLRRRLGEAQWTDLSARMLERLTQRFGAGPIDFAPKAWLGLGVRA